MARNAFDYSAYDRTVVGFHGTDEEAAERLVNGEPFKASDRDMELDCAVFNYLFDTSDAAGSPIQTARAVYVPAGITKRIWKGSWISDETHLQI